MGRKKAEKKSNGNVAKRQAGLKIMYGAVETQDPKPFDPDFMNKGAKTVSEVNPQERMMRDELQEFIDKFQLFTGQVFDDPSTDERYFGRVSEQVLGLIDGRRLIYLMCIDKIPNITIDEFLDGVMGPTRKTRVVYSKIIDMLTDWMYQGMVKNHRLTPNEGETGRKDYSIHGSKVLELTDECRQMLFKVESMLPQLTKDILLDAVTRRDMLIKKIRKEEKVAKKQKEKSLFSQDTLDAVAKMKELLARK